MNTDFRKFVFSSVVALFSASAFAQVAPAPSVPENSGAARPAPPPAPPTNSGAAGPPADPVANTPADPTSPGAVILPAPGTPPVDGTRTGTLPAAQSRPVPSPFSKFDTDGDGKLTQEEAKGDAVLYNKFKEMDANRDSFISSDEFRASGLIPASISKPAK